MDPRSGLGYVSPLHLDLDQKNEVTYTSLHKVAGLILEEASLHWKVSAEMIQAILEVSEACQLRGEPEELAGQLILFGFWTYD